MKSYGVTIEISEFVFKRKKKRIFPDFLNSGFKMASKTEGKA